jgi:hypothetical protein
MRSILWLGRPTAVLRRPHLRPTLRVYKGAFVRIRLKRTCGVLGYRSTRKAVPLSASSRLLSLASKLASKPVQAAPALWTWAGLSVRSTVSVKSGLGLRYGKTGRKTNKGLAIYRVSLSIYLEVRCGQGWSGFALRLSRHTALLCEELAIA